MVLTILSHNTWDQSEGCWLSFGFHSNPKLIQNLSKTLPIILLILARGYMESIYIILDYLINSIYNSCMGWFLMYPKSSTWILSANPFAKQKLRMCNFCHLIIYFNIYNSEKCKQLFIALMLYLYWNVNMKIWVLEKPVYGYPLDQLQKPRVHCTAFTII